jgi:hypothetical protein
VSKKHKLLLLLQFNRHGQEGESEKSRNPYMRHSTLLSWLQKGQLKTVASFSWLFLGGGLAADFLFPILRIGGAASEAKTHRSVDTDERKKNLFRETVERDICKEERRRGLSASKQTRVKLDCKTDLGTRGPTSRGLGFEGLLPASSCVCRDAHVVCC